jgi:hypothetical protein
MVADFVSADYGWLRSPDGKESVWVLFKAGKGHEGYFMNENIKDQMDKAMAILEKYFPNDNHVFLYDNATTHLKRSDEALSARNMTKGPSDKFGVLRTVTDDAGKQVHAANGTLLKEKIRMGKGRMPNGEEQDFYFPDDHPTHPGFFKGLTIILEKCGFTGVSGKGAKLMECKGVHCPPSANDCCCRCMLFCQPDFAEVESTLEITAKSHGFEIIFFPKFHCELNFIEQCWGYAKWCYRMYPPSSKEADLESNLIAALEEVPQSSMC